MIAIDRAEIRRYLGVRAPQADDATELLITRCWDALTREAAPKSVWRMCDLVMTDDGAFTVADMQVVSRNLARNLKGCDRVFLFAATLGVGADRLIARAGAVRVSEAVVLQAAAAMMIEAYCDEINADLREQAAAQGFFCRPRFSPGYGDFSIVHQRDFIRLLDTPRKIGLTVTDGMVLAPIKSVTALIGLSRQDEDCHRHGCELCDKINCAFRRQTT